MSNRTDTHHLPNFFGVRDEGSTQKRSTQTAPISTPQDKKISRDQQTTKKGKESTQRTSITSLRPLPTISKLLFPSSRPGRHCWENPTDMHPQESYGDSIQQKDPNNIRIFFQNVKGLTHTTGMEDYYYYIQGLTSMHIDIAGLSETNTAWQHFHLQSDFRKQIRKHYRQSRVHFGYPVKEIDQCSERTSFQPGGNLTLVNGNLTSSSFGNSIEDPTGLGRWSGMSFRGKEKFLLTTITAYRTCGGNHRTASLGSTYSREYHYFRDRGHTQPQPRRLFLQHLETEIKKLQSAGHAIILMLDANSDLTDSHFVRMIESCELSDLHRKTPAPSTYIRAKNRRIDYILGCPIMQKKMTRSGTLAYSEGPQSDHRGLFADFEISELQSFLSVPPISNNATRYLHTGNPELVSSYIQSMLKYYTEHNMIRRIEDLHAIQNQMTKEEIQDKLIRWDRDQGRAMKMAENKLRVPPKKYAWSPTLRNTAILCKYWKLRLHESTKHLNYRNTFRRWQQKVQNSDPTFVLPDLEKDLSVDDIRMNLSRATKAFRRAQQQSIPLRQQTYESLITIYSEDEDPTTRKESLRKLKIVQRTIDTEVCRKTFRDIRNILKPTSHSAISQIQVPRQSQEANELSGKEMHECLSSIPKEDIIWDTIIDREAIERHLLHYNREAFRAAAASLCGHGVIYQAITFSSLSPSAETLLKGMVPESWHGDNTILKEFLASFTIPQHVQNTERIVTTISDNDVSNGFKKWTESTTTSPSGRHLGHYKALIQDPTLLRCLTLFLDIILSNGLTIPRWCEATNVMIEKDPGSPRIHRLRIIHLFEADFNFILKLMWGHRLVRRAIELDLLHQGQHGSIPGRTTLDPIMLTQLTTDISRVQKTNMIRFDNDASACYDRIIVALGMLAARRCGMPDNAISTHANALKWMKYKVKTIYGISEDNYSGTEFEPLFGTGQGSGASPAVWLSLVVILLHTLDRLIPERMSFSTPNGKIQHERLTDAYVDDTSLGFTDHQSALNYEELINRLQSVAQTWSDLLELSGGTLNFSKCSWYVIYWEWDKGRPRLRKLKQTDPSITLRSSLDHTHPKREVRITRKEPEDSIRMLGVFLSPTGNNSGQLHQYQRKAKAFASKLHSPRLTASDIRTFHRSIYVPTMRYGLTATIATAQELQKIQSGVIASMLQKMHVSSKIPTAIRHGPKALGGLDIYDLRTEIGIEQLKFLRDALYSNSAAGKMIMINLHMMQQEAGVDFPLLEHPSEPVPYITTTWLTSVRDFLADHNIKITITDQPGLTLQSTNDEFIMQRQYLSRYTTEQQRDINLVRLYLQATTLADLTDLSRPEAISRYSLDGMRKPDATYGNKWPRQEAPSRTQKRLWQRYIKSCFLRYVPMWKRPPLTAREVQENTTTHGMPQPPTVQKDNPTSFPTLMTYIKSLPRTQRRMISDVKQVATDLQIWRAFRSRERLTIASDGGLDGQHGTFGWVLATKKLTLFECGGPVDGPFDTISSTRSELCGYASALLLITAVSRNWGLRHRCTFRWITDSKSALSRAIRMVRIRSRLTRLPPDSDLLTLISSLMWELRRSIVMKWVKGHQDKLTAYDTLSTDAKLNMTADFLATRYRLRGRIKPTSHLDHPSTQRISIVLNGTRLTSQIDECIRYHINGYQMRLHMQSKRHWSNRTWDQVDFDLFGKHYQRMSSPMQVFKTKLSHDQLPLGKTRLHRSAVHDHNISLCPCCGTHSEDVNHFLRCPSNNAITSGLHALLKDSKFPDSHPIRRVLHDGIRHWITDQKVAFQPSIDGYPPEMQASIRLAIQSQSSIGWDNAIRGFLSKEWTDLASRTLLAPRKLDLHNGRRRMQSITNSLFEYARSTWVFRNECLHGRDEQKKRAILTAEEAEIRQYYTNQTMLHFDDRYLCDKNLDTLLNSSTTNKRRWLRRARLSKTRQDTDGQRQCMITSFFQRTTNEK